MRVSLVGLNWTKVGLKAKESKETNFISGDV